MAHVTMPSNMPVLLVQSMFYQKMQDPPVEDHLLGDVMDPVVERVPQ